MADKRPAYQWYPKDYLADEHVALMTLEQEGAYRRLLDYCWLHESIPADMGAMGLLCRVDSSRMAELWQGIEPCFQIEGDRYVNRRLNRERFKQDSHRESKQKAGRAGAKARWDKDKNGSAKNLPLANHGSSSAFASATAVITDLWRVWIEELGGPSPHPKLTATRSKKLKAVYDEQLAEHDDPLGRFRSILRAVKASPHHMGERAYQMPESLFRSAERRDTWAQKAQANGSSGVMDADALDEWERQRYGD